MVETSGKSPICHLVSLYGFSVSDHSAHGGVGCVKLVAMLDEAGVLPSLSHKSIGYWSSYLFDSLCSPYWLHTLHHQS